LNTPIVIAAVVVGASVAIYFIYKNSTSTHTVGYEKRKLKDLFFFELCCTVSGPHVVEAGDDLSCT